MTDSSTEEGEVDPVTAISVVNKAAGALDADKSTLRHLLFGPAFAELGQWMGEAIAQRRKKNAESILEDAEKVLQARDASEDDSSFVNPRLIKGAIDEGSWVDDPICHSYLAGLLVGGRSTGGEDDMNVPWLAMSNAMSSHEVRLHFVVYRLLAYALRESNLAPTELSSENLLWRHRVHIPVELRDEGLATAILGLRQSGLLHDVYSMNSESDEYFVSPTHSGCALFVAVHGVPVLAPSLIWAFKEGWNPALDDHWKHLDLTVPQKAVEWRKNAEMKSDEEE